MDITVSCSPSILLLKAKFHFLLHLPENIRRFGPAIMFSTERFESFNSVFRECSIHSNRQAPSRDIAHTFAHLDRVKHILSGGYWYDASQRMWVCASRKVIEQVSSQPNLAHLLGLPKPATHVPGDVQLLPFTRKPRKRPPPIEWKDSIASVHSSEHVGQNIEPKSLWDCGRAVFARNNDKAKIGDHVIVQRESVNLSSVTSFVSNVIRFCHRMRIDLLFSLEWKRYLLTRTQEVVPCWLLLSRKCKSL
jgi:hypothetical protein